MDEINTMLWLLLKKEYILYNWVWTLYILISDWNSVLMAWLLNTFEYSYNGYIFMMGDYRNLVHNFIFMLVTYDIFCEIIIGYTSQTTQPINFITLLLHSFDRQAKKLNIANICRKPNISTLMYIKYLWREGA